MAYHDCKRCGGSGYSGPMGFPSGEGDICCDGGTYTCDECECEVDDPLTEDNEHYCHDCRFECPECGGIFAYDEQAEGEEICVYCKEEQDE